jgi:hypothetical protein
MSARELPSLDAKAFQLMEILERYDQDLHALASSPSDTGLRLRVGQALDAMRPACAGVPLLSVAWVRLMISHAELLHSLWPATAPGTERRPVQSCRQDHLLAVRALREACLGAAIPVERTH